jgi:hypothetical protein
MSDQTTSATAPKHRRAHRMAAHKTTSHAMHHGTARAASGSMADDLNKQEMSRIQSGASSQPAAPPPPPAPTRSPKASGGDYAPTTR